MADNGLSKTDLLGRFGIGVTVAYATGFFIVFSFLGSYGITEFGGDIFRLKYLYIGVLCLSFPFFVVVPFFLAIRNIWPHLFFQNAAKNPTAIELKKSHAKHIVDLPATLVFLNMITMIYLIVGIFGAIEFWSRKYDIVTLVLGSIILLWCIKKIFAYSNKEHHAGSDSHVNPYTSFILRSLLFVFAVYYDTVLCRGLDISDLRRRAPIYVLVMFAAGWRCVRLHTELEYEGPTPSWRITSQVSIIFALFVIGILAYMVSIYPYISASFGGGDFSKTSNEVICIEHGVMPNELMQSPHCTRPVKIIHETDTMFYVAPAFLNKDGSFANDDKQGAVDQAPNWRQWPSSGLPSIYTIPKKYVGSVSDATRIIVDSETGIVKEKPIDKSP